MRRFLRNEQGATAIEYGVIVAVIVLALLAGLTMLGGSNDSIFTNLAAKAEENM